MNTTAEITGRTYGVELLFESDYDVRAPEVLATLRTMLPNADVRASESIAIFHQDVPIQLKDARICAQTAILPSDEPIVAGEFDELLRQTRDWAGAPAAVARAKRRLLVTDVMSSSLPAPIRLQTFQRALAAIVTATNPSAIVWTAAYKLVEPREFLRAMDQPKFADRAFVALNVRLFNVRDRAGEAVMDTAGLAWLGLPDLQLHFVGLDPNAVATYLFNSAFYVLENGDVIADGNTIDGIPARSGKKWRCRHEHALITPPRIVLDIDPGSPHAASHPRS